MFAEYRGRRGAHCIHVERPIQGVGLPCQEWRADFAAKDAVFVRFMEGAMPRMKRRRDAFQGEDANILWQGAVKGAMEIFRGYWSRQCAGCHLSQGVYTGVCAAGTLRQYLLSGNAFDGRSEFSLDGAMPGLHLPSVKIGAIVCDHELPHMLLVRKGIVCFSTLGRNHCEPRIAQVGGGVAAIYSSVPFRINFKSV